ncbi:MAG: protoheme IX farnesyltransferase [Gammaproteobacteria bacterium]|jgi:protoheme IX farnesyltransferase
MTELAGLVPPSALWRDYLALCKLKVVALIVFTAVVGMFLATPGFVPLDALIFGNIGIGLGAASGAAFNHIVDQRIDALMARTRARPLPRGRVSQAQAIAFASTLTVISVVVLVLGVNVLTAALTFASMVGYSVVYTMYLKRATPQNIVIGGAAGAMPPVLGWTSVTGTIDGHALLLFLIIFAWTPPHFWALAIHRRDDYAKADIPMLPVTHGLAFTRLQILLYTVILCVVSMLPFVTGMSGPIYLGGAFFLGLAFMGHALRLFREDKPSGLPMRTFTFSIWYLAALFAVLLLDHYVPRPM